MLSAGLSPWNFGAKPAPAEPVCAVCGGPMRSGAHLECNPARHPYQPKAEPAECPVCKGFKKLYGVDTCPDHGTHAKKEGSNG